MVGLVAEMLFVVCLYVTQRNELKMSECKGYWPMGFPLIIYQARAKK